MICPYCGYVEKSIVIPEISCIGVTKHLDFCCSCGGDIWIITEEKTREFSKEHTIVEGNRRAKILIDELSSYYKNRLKIEERDAGALINYIVYKKSNNNHLGYMEIIERTCTINAYRQTIFNKSKVQEGKKLIEQLDRPVLIIFKFKDCWAYHKINLVMKYLIGMEASFPSYRKEQKFDDKQITVFLPVEKLTVLKLRNQCFNGKVFNKETRS